jgi:hypothetical protein
MVRILHTHSASELAVEISGNRRFASFRFFEQTGDVRILTCRLQSWGGSTVTSQTDLLPSLDVRRTSEYEQREVASAFDPNLPLAA